MKIRASEHGPLVITETDNGNRRGCSESSLWPLCRRPMPVNRMSVQGHDPPVGTHDRSDNSPPIAASAPPNDWSIFGSCRRSGDCRLPTLYQLHPLGPEGLNWGRADEADTCRCILKATGSVGRAQLKSRSGIVFTRSSTAFICVKKSLRRSSGKALGPSHFALSGSG